MPVPRRVAEEAARGQRALQRQGHLPCRWSRRCRRRTGWNAPSLAPWLQQALDSASQAHFGAPCGYIGQGGTIPLMNMLQQSFPKAQMMVCGVLGPKSNAHGPNEFLHVPYGKRLTAAVAQVMAACP
jgi:acetylornithine deacetylase/succinyl-diaminopimelate desuccinylase-like protein